MPHKLFTSLPAVAFMASINPVALAGSNNSTDNARNGNKRHKRNSKHKPQTSGPGR